VWHPGVYVWWHSVNGVIKVGRHFTNSRKRAIEHINANTGGKMRDFASDNNTKIILFNVIDKEKIHWVAALEVFFERVLSPEIKAARLG